MQAASVPLVDPESSVLWRASFAIAALGGAMALIALRGAAPGKLGLTAYISAIVPYLLIGPLAISPHSAARLGFQAAPLRVEAALLIILVFAGVHVAWLQTGRQAGDLRGPVRVLEVRHALPARGGRRRIGRIDHAVQGRPPPVV